MTKKNQNNHKSGPGHKGQKGKYHSKPRRDKKSPQKDLKGAANIFGTHAVSHAWANPDRRIKNLYITSQALRPASAWLDQKPGPERPEPQIVERRQLDKLCKGAVHQGIAIEAEPLPEQFLSDLLIRTENNENSLLVMLDHVTDPHNVGAVLRSACAFGADGLIQQKRHAPSPEGVLAKSASGAAEYIPMIDVINLSHALDELKDSGFTAIALDERGDPINSVLPEPPGKCVIVLGAEGKGLRPKVRESCSVSVKIPTSGKIAALNVSNAAAISLYHVSRKG